MSTKNALTPAAIEPATFRFVEQHLNHCATAVSNQESEMYKQTMAAEYIPLYIHRLNVLENHSTAMPYVPCNRRSAVQPVDADCNDYLEDEESSLPVCYTAPTGKCLTTFPKSALPPSSRSTNPKRVVIWL